MKRTLCVFAFLVTILPAPTMCALSRSADSLKKSSGLTIHKQPNDVQTRIEFDILKKVILQKNNELPNEDNINPSILPSANRPKQVKKSGRYMGICMRKQFNSYIPFPCLRRG